jgi:predicted ATPase/class 3 adenylate cyclase
MVETPPPSERHLSRALPSGTVTFLFTDIEGSTRLLDELGDAYAEALAEHRRQLRAVFARHGGIEVDTQGDAFFVAFARASDAIAAGAESQQVLEDGPIRVRMGVHTGEPTVTEEGYVGIDVHRAARIAAAGHGGQLLVSQTTYDLAATGGLRDLGEHRLKDLSAPERLYQLGVDDFPPLRTLYQSNLPVPATAFLGREDELAGVRTLLARPEVRLLTLTGAGGSGKTRLALQAAGAAADDYPQGVWWVPLAPVRDADSVFEAAARGLGVTGTLAESIGQRRLLLLLDNFEHVIGAAAGLSQLLLACPNLDVLVTSRERLQLGAEHVYPVPVLTRPDARALFVARARAVQPEFDPGPALDELCDRLDDLPLALELAAARTTILTTEQLLARLGQRLDLLRGGRDADLRQQTLRATIEWSYDLLDQDERDLLARLSVFEGGCTLEAGEAVCDAGLDRLQSLVDKSLVRLRDGERFWMLESVREFALERLRDSGREDDLQRRHAEFFLQLAESAHLSPDTVDLGQQHELVIPEQDNLRGAIDQALERGDALLGLRLAIALEQFWIAQDPNEGRRRLELLLAAAAGAPAPWRARGLRALGGATYIVGEFERGTELHEQSLEEFRSLGDELAAAHILHRLAAAAMRVGDRSRARRLSGESLETYRRYGSPSGEAMALGLLAELTADEGRLDEAIRVALKSASFAAEVGFGWWQLHQLYNACEWSLAHEHLDEAEEYGTAALRIAQEIGDRQMTIYLLSLVARFAIEHQDTERAGRLWGAIETEEARAPIGQWEKEREAYAAPLLRGGGAGFERGRTLGRTLSLDEAVRQAVDERPGKR